MQPGPAAAWRCMSGPARMLAAGMRQAHDTEIGAARRLQQATPAATPAATPGATSGGRALCELYGPVVTEASSPRFLTRHKVSINQVTKLSKSLSLVGNEIS